MIEQVVDILNDILKTDPEAVSALVNNRVKCNQELANHNSVQVSGTDVEPTVGILGILNGFIEPLTGNRVAVQYDDPSKINKFIVYPLTTKIRLNIKDDEGPTEF
jgi:hypothetical protein